MKIYFAGSIRGGREDREIYAEIIEMLKKYGEVSTEHIGSKDITHVGEIGNTDEFILNRDMDWLRATDVVVAEVTTPSLGVGYELGQAEALKKKVLCLYRSRPDKSLSAMIRGNKYFQVADYNSVDELPAILDKFFK